ncbi:DUF3108 domain-containing protein [Acidipila sp. EB88]|uniref:DUF3108 domain-containing protein n=1 Tax=Acidipila sp. EB88 TaxID=2305226 RepID=UPI000F5FE2EB|nr:DUF3108 domain-containing protein [Acidipila sp. EB88]RRA48633.1 DUF3108 domain-containing protein [Acidipila sp. EB88]
MPSWFSRAWVQHTAVSGPVPQSGPGAARLAVAALILCAAFGSAYAIRPAAVPGPATPRPAIPPVTVASASFPAPSAGWSFPQRQTLTYAVDWRVFPAGTATVHLETDGPLERISVTGDSQGAINLLFRVSDRFQSSFDRTTGCSQSFTRQLMEGRRQIDSEQHIDPAHHVTTYDERNLVSRVHLQQTADLPPCVTDMLSGIYYTGSQSLDPGSTVHLPVVAGNHFTLTTLHTEARETVRTPTTTYHTVRVQVTADTGAIRNRGKLWIWYSDDQRHIPVQMRARLFWGTITFRLTSLDNR